MQVESQSLPSFGSYLRYIRPPFPTLDTVKCLPSRPADAPSGAISTFSALSCSLLARRPIALSSCDFLSATVLNDFEAVAGERRDLASPGGKAPLRPPDLGRADGTLELLFSRDGTGRTIRTVWSCAEVSRRGELSAAPRLGPGGLLLRGGGEKTSPRSIASERSSNGRTPTAAS
jgi:hypothetical protein